MASPQQKAHSAYLVIRHGGGGPTFFGSSPTSRCLSGDLLSVQLSFQTIVLADNMPRFSSKMGNGGFVT